MTAHFIYSSSFVSVFCLITTVVNIYIQYLIPSYRINDEISAFEHTIAVYYLTFVGCGRLD